MASAQRIVLASRPVGEPKPENFRLEQVEVPKPGPGQVLLRTIWDILKGQEPSLSETRTVRFYTVRSSIRPELWQRPPDPPELILTIEL